MPRRCFYSFHFKPDCHRAAQVRQIGSIETSRPATDNDWEAIVGRGNAAIQNWIDNQIAGKSCAIVLVGAETANRKWINYEIIRSWDEGLGLVGIHIHGLKSLDGNTSVKGANPFDFITHGPTQRRLSSIVKCYDPSGVDSKARYTWISSNLAAMVEEAITIRNAT
jgi:hypothetical protein